jgi:RND family efflux transporter MFP subunit
LSIAGSAIAEGPSEPALMGVFVAREAAELAPLVSGRLSSLTVRIGERVTRGQVVATIDASAQRLDVRVANARALQARAELAVSQAEAELAKEQETSVLGLAEVGLASGSDQTHAVFSRRTAELRARAARAFYGYQRASARRVQRDREEAILRAPFDGVVVARYADPGANVTPDRPLLRILQNGAPIVRFALPEELDGAVKLGSVIRARTLGQHPKEVRGVVRRIASEVDPAARWFVIEADTEGDTDQIMPGSAADVYLTEY